MCYREGVSVKFILKIKQNFMDNPIVTLSGNDIKLEEVQGKGDGSGEGSDEGEGDEKLSEEDFVKLINGTENIDEIFEKQTKFKNLNIKELVIYKIGD